MSVKNIFNYLFLLVILCGFNKCFSQNTNFIVDQNRDRKLIWCVVGPEEMKKCQAFAEAVTKDISYFGGDILQLTCKSGFNKEECMSLVDEEKAHITSLDAGEVFVGGRYHSLIPIMQEIYPGGLRSYYAVAVIKKGALPEVSNLRHLRGKKACFAGVGTQAGWVIPVYTLMREGGMEVIDCNNHVKSTINYFGPSCAVNSLIDKYNPIGDNSDKLCQLCIGRVPGEKCTSADPYSGFEGAFRCLVEAGDIAFLKHTTVLEMTRFKHEFVSVQNSDFELLCRDGSRRPVDAYISCNWGSVPPHAVVTTSAKPAKLRRTYQRFLEKASQLYGGKHTYNNETSTRSTTANPQNSYQPKSYQPNEYEYQRNQFGFRQDEYQPKDSQQNAGIPNNTFHLFESAPRYGLKHNLLFQDAAENLEELSEGKQTYTGYLGETLNLILAVRQCPVNRMTMCVTSDPELEKCIKMRTALKAQLLKPEMICYKGHSQIHCMQAIRNGNADVAVLDAGDVYTAGLNYDLIPFISEIYDLGSPEYYVVAVAKEEDPSTELTYLKGKLTCHPGVNTGAGWIVPLAYLISNGWMRPYGCDSMRAAAEYFSKSCVPGALSTEYNTGVPYDNMCDLCHGASFRYCRRDASEAYYGYTGAFKCLVEGGGHVAFLKHTTVMENADGKRKEWWARNILNEDFELLCPDGTRSTMHDYRRCNLGTVKANAIVTRGGEAWNGTEINAFINLFIYAQQFYGRKDPDEFSFSMFYSQPPYSDLIFQDAATQLQVIPTPLRYYDTYLGKDFMRAKRIVDCHAGSDASMSNVMLVLSLTLLSAVPAVLMGRGFI